MNEKISSLKRYAIIVACVCIVYIPMITEKLANPDTLWNGMHYKDGFNWECSLGRWGLGVFAWFKGYYISPAIATITSILFLTLAALLIADIFDIKTPFGIIFVIVCSLISIQTADMLTYYYCSDAYSFALLIDIVAIYIITRWQKWYTLSASVFLILISYSIYQAYIGICIVLAICVLVYKLLIKCDSLKSVITHATYYALAGAFGTLFYLITTKILGNFYTFSLTDDRSFSQMGHIDISYLPQALKNCYIKTYAYFFTNDIINNSWMHQIILNWIIFITMFICFCIYIVNHYKKSQGKLNELFIRTAICVILLLFLPIGFMITQIIAPGVNLSDATGILIIPSMYLYYVLFFVLLSNISLSIGTINQIRNASLYLLCTVWISCSLMYVGLFQDGMKNNIDLTYNIASDIEKQLQLIPNSEGYKLIIDGHIDLVQSELYYVLDGTVAPYGCIWNTSNGSIGCWKAFFKEYLGKTHDMATYDELLSVRESTTYKQCPTYPNNGYLYTDGEFIIVKLSEP